ncbi:glucose-6-phosphate isomerase [Candidatus Mycoplasma pogonae]
MKRLNLNLDFAIEESKVLDLQNQVNNIATKINDKTSVGSDFLGWIDLVEKPNTLEIADMKKTAEFLHQENVEVLVVIGIGGSYLGAKAAIDFVQGQLPLASERKMEIIFSGTSVSSIALSRQLEYVKNKKFAINIISKSGTTTEPAIAFRLFANLLEAQIGAEEAKKFIIATTDGKKGTLYNLATQKGYKKFIIPDDVGGRFSVLSPVGALPIMATGVDFEKILKGASKANDVYKKTDLKVNDAYKYAVARYLLSKKYAVEMLVSYEPDFAFFNEWWKQLFGESEGKDGKGLMPASVIFSTDLHSLGQFIQEGSKVLFETVMTVKNPSLNVKLEAADEDLDELNYLAGKTVHDVNKAAFEATLKAHSQEGQVPNIHLLLEDNKEETLGWLIMFFERACAVSAYLLGVNPFDQPGVEVYKKNMFKILDKPSK